MYCNVPIDFVLPMWLAILYYETYILLKNQIANSLNEDEGDL